MTISKPSTRRQFMSALLAAPAVMAAPRLALAREPEVFASNGYAIGGFDPVAYFTKSAPVAGSNAHRLMWRGATWRFETEDNAARFEANPTAFAPLFGGYCAYAASLGYLAPTRPEAWTVYQNRLYLNANLRARELWLQDIPGNIAKGLANWPAVLG